jgi:hypothetical protein
MYTIYTVLFIKHCNCNRGGAMQEVMADGGNKHAKRKDRYGETLLAIESVEAGRFIDGDEVFAWLDSWGTEAETNMPEC